MKHFSRAIAALLAAVLVLTFLGVPAKAAACDGFRVNLRVWDDEASFSARLIADPVNTVAALSLEASVPGYDRTYDLDGTIYADAGRLALSSNTFLDRCYGIDFADISANLPTSVLHPDSGSYFSLNLDTYNLISQALQGDSRSNPLLLLYANVLKEAFSANVQSTTGTETRTLCGREVTAETVTYTLGSDFIVTTASALADVAGCDSLLKAITALVLEMNGTASRAEMTGMEYANSIWDNWDADSAQLLSALRQANPSVSLKTYICDDLSALELTITAEETPLTLLLTVDDLDTSITLTATGSGRELYRTVFTVSRNGFSLKVTQRGMPILRVYLNLAEDGYMLSFSDRPSPRSGWTTISGRIIDGDDDITITVDNINGETDVQAELTLTGSQEPLSFPNFLDLLTLSNEEAELLAIYLYSNIQMIDF